MVGSHSYGLPMDTEPVFDNYVIVYDTEPTPNSVLECVAHEWVQFHG